jgi:hypothetical protein
MMKTNRLPTNARWDTAGVDHWATIGGAFEQRLVFLVAHEPSYAVYLGAAEAGLLGGAMLDTVVNRWPAHRPFGVSRASPGAACQPPRALDTELAQLLNLWHTPVPAHGADQLIGPPGVGWHEVVRAQREHTAVRGLVGLP